MKGKITLVLGLVGSLSFATTNNVQANVELTTKYMKFNNDSNQEYKDMYSIGLRGNIKYESWVIQIGNTYQKWIMADWLKQLTNEGDSYANVPYVRVNKLLGDKILGIGLIHVAGDYFASDGAWGINVNFAGNIYNGDGFRAIGEIFWQYTAIRNGKVNAKADITQFTPNVAIFYKNIAVNPYITLQNINAYNGNIDTVKFSGGIKFKVRVNNMFGLNGNIKYGRTVYYSDGESMDVMARYNRFKVNVGVDIKPIQHLIITPKLYYEGYETFEKDILNTKIQKGLGLGLNISYNF